MDRFSPAMPHGPIQEVFPDVFLVTGTMRGPFFGSVWQFSRNMTVVREGDRLTLINAVRLDEVGLAALDALGKVVNVVKLGSMHGVDDAFYLDRYKATYWALPGMSHPEGVKADRELVPGGEMPISDTTLFAFEAVKLPEGILILQREGGIAIACDSLQNWVAPDEFFLPETVATMTPMGFFTRANLGPAWMHVNEPRADDFVRLRELPFQHALCGHGAPLSGAASEHYRATFKRVFDV